MHTPEQTRAPFRSNSGFNRRQFATRASIGSALVALVPASSHAMSNLARGVYQPKGSGGSTTPETYEGPLYGHEVSWDTDAWIYSLSADEGDDYDYDFVSLTGIATAALSTVVHQDVPVDDIETAVDEALPHYLSQYGTDLVDIELLDSWESDDAVGFMWYWLDYDDKPYTYIEYSLTEEDGIWCVSYIQFRASSWDEDAVTMLLDGITVDGDPLVRATDVVDIVEVVAADVE
jgi:hypothetical protein